MGKKKLVIRKSDYEILLRKSKTGFVYQIRKCRIRKKFGAVPLFLFSDEDCARNMLDEIIKNVPKQTSA